jgi:hypothetical protein
LTAAAVWSAGGTAPAATAAAGPRAESPRGYNHRAVLPEEFLASSVCIHGSRSSGTGGQDVAYQHSSYSSSTATAVAGGRSDSAAAAADARYAELLARLQMFMPALSAAASPAGDFESTWQVVKVGGQVVAWC